jgi:hypothetical protein
LLDILCGSSYNDNTRSVLFGSQLWNTPPQPMMPKDIGAGR